MILRIYDATIRRLLVLFYTTVRIYVSTDHFAFTPLSDSTHLRCYCTPTVSFVLYHCTFLASTFLRLTLLLHDWTILRIYDATVRRLSVLFYTTLRFYASTMLQCQFCFILLYVSTHLHFYGSLCFYTTRRF